MSTQEEMIKHPSKGYSRSGGMFIAVEGHDGVGKTTQIPLLKMVFEDMGYEVITTREPGGTPESLRIREILLDKNSNLCPRAELLLFAAARANHVEHVIRPAVDAGKVVICDRYMLSTAAYQGYGRGMDMGLIAQLERASHGDYIPDYTLVLHAPFEVLDARMRVNRNDLDRFDGAEREFRERVYNGYNCLVMGSYVPHIVRIDADGDVDSIRIQMENWARSNFSKQTVTQLNPVV